MGKVVLQVVLQVVLNLLKSNFIFYLFLYFLRQIPEFLYIEIIYINEKEIYFHKK